VSGAARADAEGVTLLVAVVAALRRLAAPVERARIAVVALLGVAVGGVTSAGEPADLIWFARHGRSLLEGDLAAVYADPANQGGPLQLLAAALLAPVGTGLDSPHLALVHLVGAPLLAVGALIGVRFLRRSAGSAPAPGVELLTGVLGALWLAGGAALDGHAAQLAIPVSWLAGAVLLRTGRPLVAAVVLGGSAAWEPWGVLGCALLLSLPLAAALRAGAVAAAVAAGAYLPFVLTGSFHLPDHAWRVQDGTLVAMVIGAGEDLPWALRLLQAALAVLAGAVLVRLLRGRADALWLPLAAVLVVRLLLDPLAYTYYSVSTQVVCLAGLGLSRGARDVVGRLVLLLVVTAWLTPVEPWSAVCALGLVGHLCRGQTDRLGLSCSSRASSPLTKPADSSVERLPASSTASLTATASGTSAHHSSS
jgi:hypothetical protein